MSQYASVDDMLEELLNDIEELESKVKLQQNVLGNVASGLRMLKSGSIGRSRVKQIEKLLDYIDDQNNKLS